jgi:hypothetical protein
MKLTKRILLSIISIAIVACGEHGHGHGDGEAHHKTEKPHTEEHEAHDEDKLKLNHGEKWLVNEATQVGMQKLSDLIKAFNTTEVIDYKVLGDSLETQTNYIIHNCNMKGEPHNQLHIVLHPILVEVAAFKEAKTTTTTNDMEQLLNEYFKHFEYKK